MNYYENIKQELIDNEVYKKVKDYSKNRSDLNTYYNVGKMLSEAGKHYGEGIIKEYSNKLTNELGKGYTFTSLTRMKKFYLLIEKLATVSQQLTYGHYVELLPISNYDEIKYYIRIIEQENLSIRELRNRIKLNEYGRLDNKTKENLRQEKKLGVHELIKNPIILKTDKEIVKEKALKKLILENMDEFLEQLGNGFSYLKNEYKIKIGNSYNYID